MTQPLSRIEIFRPGRHTAMSGEAIAFSEAELQASAEAYDPALHEAPIVVGHPRHDAPAYGWVGALSYGDGLEAEPRQVDEQFAEMVRNGRFKKVSASFYKPDSAANPKPGVYYLRHVGFLGAQPPAVKGLKPVEFADAGDGDGVVEIAFAEAEAGVLRQILRRLREWFIEHHGRAAADQIVSDVELEMVARPEPEPESSRPAFSEAKPKDEQKEPSMSAQDNPDRHDPPAAAPDARFAEKQRELEDREQRLAQREAEARQKDTADFVEGLVNDGRVLPRDRDGLVAFMAALDAEAVVAFGEGDRAVRTPASAWLRDFLAKLPPAVDYGEHAPAEGDEEAGAASFAAPPGYAVNTERLELHRKATAYQRQHPGTDYMTAVAAVSNR